MEFHKRHIKILIVDDDVNFVHSLSNMLGGLGYATSVAFSPVEAEILIRQQPFHIVFVDCLMPEMDGYSFAKNIEKEFGISIKVLLMSGVFNTSDINYMEHRNILSMVKKPIDPEALKAEVESAINQIIEPEKDQHLAALLCDQSTSLQNIYKLFSKVKYLNEGDILLLFFYLLYSKSESILSISDEKHSIEIGLSSGNVVYFSEQDRSRITSYFAQNNILQEEELVPFLDANGTENLHGLIAHGLISPHHYVQYVKDGVNWGIEYFSKKTRVHVQLQQNPLSEDEDIEQDLEVSLNASQFIQHTTRFIETDLSLNFLQGLMESLKEYRLHVDDSRRKAWGKYVILPFKFVYDQIDDLKSSTSLNDLLSMYPNEQNIVYRIVFWLLSQNVITLKQDTLAQLSQVYVDRYKSLYKTIRGMDLVNMFKFFGCTNTSDLNQIKKVFSSYTEHNHVDVFSQYSLEVQKWVNQCHQVVINAYNVVGDSQKMKSYQHKKQMKAAQDIIEVENLKKDVQKLIQHTKYGEAFKLSQKIQAQANTTKAIKNEMFLWDTVIEIEQSEFSMKTQKVRSISEQVQTVVHQTSLPMDLYYYVSGLLEMCDDNNERAEFFFQKSLKENAGFTLAKIKQLKLKDAGKSQFLNLEKLLTNKKKTA
ncbi:MAG: response regulator [Bdellovibrionales bacterium]|nr:response regulator [Bdellovibrionales bacterium]